MRRIILSLCLSFAPVLIAQNAPDLIIVNAKVFTGDATSPKAEALAITGDHVSAVGTSDQIKSIAGDSTKRIDAKGRVVIPGINDALMQQCTTPSMRLITTAESSGDDVLAAVSSATDESPTDIWISGSIGEKAINDPALTTASLDKASQAHRVLLVSSNGDAIIVNSGAFQTLRTNDSHDPFGGWWMRDASGRSSGKGFEYAARNLLRRWAEQTEDAETMDALKEWGAQAVQLGITTAQISPCLTFNRFERFARRASLPLRVRVINTPLTNADSRNVDELREMPKPSGARSMLDVSGIRWILGGGAKPNFSASEIASMIKEAGDQQLDFAASDASTAATLLDALKASPAKRVRIETHALAGTLPMLRERGVVVIQRGAPGKDDVLKSVVKGGVPLAVAANGSPWTTLPYLLGEWPEALTREQAMEALTRGGAYAENAEGEKGTIANGKLADVVILDRDIFTAGLSSLPETRSVMTIIGGKIVYDAHVLASR